MLRIETTLGADAEIGLTAEQRDVLGGGVRIPVAGTINGTRFRTTVFRMGDFTGIAFRKQVQAQAGIAPGDTVVVELERDTEPRQVEVPPELAAALDTDAEAKVAYDELSFTHRREYAEWVAEAKRQETRDRRAAETLDRLRQGLPPH